jgi:hypothetical protein
MCDASGTHNFVGFVLVDLLLICFWLNVVKSFTANRLTFFEKLKASIDSRKTHIFLRNFFSGLCMFLCRLDSEIKNLLMIFNEQ